MEIEDAKKIQILPPHTASRDFCLGLYFNGNFKFDHNRSTYIETL
jgi:hypothetical protein